MLIDGSLDLACWLSVVSSTDWLFSRTVTFFVFLARAVFHPFNVLRVDGKAHGPIADQSDILPTPIHLHRRQKQRHHRTGNRSGLEVRSP